MSNIVLIPGAWLGSWVWKKIIPALEDKGHSVYPITLTGMGDRVHLASPELGFETTVQDVLNVIRFNELDDIVLVGHSFAGKVAAAVADRVHEKLRMLIYLDAFRAEKTREPQGEFDPTTEFGPPPSGQFSIPFSEEILEAIGSDVKGEDRKWMLSNATPWPLKYASDPMTLSDNFDRVKVSYIFCSGSGDPVDEIIQGKWGKLSGPHRVIDSGHWPMVTRPDQLVDDLLDLIVH